MLCTQTQAMPLPENNAAAQEDASMTDFEEPAGQGLVPSPEPDFIPELRGLPSRNTMPLASFAGSQTPTTLSAPIGPPMGTPLSQGSLEASVRGSQASLHQHPQSLLERGPITGIPYWPAGATADPATSPVDASAAAARALPMMDDRMQAASKYQAALLRLRAEPGWLRSGPVKRQEAFEALWGQFSIKQWQERGASQVTCCAVSVPGLCTHWDPFVGPTGFPTLKLRRPLYPYLLPFTVLHVL